MLAKFENGYFLEVVHNEDDNEYNYSVYNEDMEQEDIYGGWTEYRSIEMYYPMNEIDYILEFCEPDYVKGKYELLKFETMEDYEDYLDDLFYGEPDGDWCLEGQGTYEDNIKYYKTEEDARTAMLMEVNELLKERKYLRMEELQDGCEVCRDEFYQRWSIYKNIETTTEVERIIKEIRRNIHRTYVGIDQYAFELQDTYVASTYLDDIEKLINELEELIK